MKKKKNKKIPVDGYPDLKLGVQKWEICVMAGCIILIAFVAYMVCNM